MNRSRAHFLVNVLSYLVFVGLASTGFLLAYRLPARSCSNSLAGLTRHEWGDLHFYLSLAFVGLLVFHLFLNWKWVTGAFTTVLSGRKADGSARGAGGMLVLLLLGAVTAAVIAGPWLLSVEVPSGGGDSRHGAGGGQDIRGSMTLADVAEAEKVDLRRLVSALGLPEDTPGSARLGPLARRHGFEMRQVREAAARLRGAR